MPGDAPPMHLKTAMSILQPEVGKPDRERSRRFIKGGAAKEGAGPQQDDRLQTGSFYALAFSRGGIRLPNPTVLGTTFFLVKLTTLAQIERNKASKTPDSAQIGERGLRATFVKYTRNQDDIYLRSESHVVADLDDGDVRVICRVSVTDSDGGVKLDAGVEGSLARRSFVHELAGHERISVVVRAVAAERETTVSVSRGTGKRTRALQRQRRPPPPPLPFTITNDRAIGEVTKNESIFDARESSRRSQCHLQSGDVILSVNDENVTTGPEARAALRAALGDASADGGGDVPVVVWRPPVGFVSAEPTQAAPSASTTTQLTKRSLPRWTDQEMRNLRRITTCLYNGAKTKTNVEAICKALGITSAGSIPVLKILIETELRRRNFENDTKWKPTDEDLDDLNKVEAVPAHRLSTLTKYLRALPPKIAAS